jgi:hypothetical protein
MALMLSFSWLFAQKVVYDQLGVTDLGNTWFSAQGSGFQTYQAISADDFDVPAQGMVLTGVVFNYANDYFEGLNVKVYEDASGIPGEIFDSFTLSEWELTTITSEKHLVKAMFPYELELTEGKYWVSVAGTGMYYYGRWFVTDSETTIGLPAKYMALTDEFMGFPLDNPIWGENPSADGVHFNLSFALLTYPEPNDLALKLISNPVTGETTADQEISVVILNAGLDTQTSFDVMYQVSSTIDGVLTELESFTESVSGLTLKTKETYEHTFSQKVDMSAITTYSLKAKVMLANDQNLLNDSYQTTVKNYGSLYVLGTDKEVTACDGIFVDDGSVLGNYTEASTDTITFYPGTDGNRVSLEFTTMDIGGDIDIFDFYDGENTDAPKLFEYARYSNVYPEHILARNPLGAVTVVVNCGYAYGYPGWEANVSCIIPDEIDFKALALQVGNGIDFNLKGKPVDVIANVTNAGSDTLSRKVYLLENNVIVDSLSTQSLIPGQIDTLTFTWVPALVSDEVSVKIMIQDDTQATNADNSVESIVAVYKPGTLLESFETGGLPLAWVSKLGTSGVVQNSYSATHGEYYLSVGGNDTVIMPIMWPNETNQLVFDAYPDYSNPFMVLVSKDMDGPWDTVGIAAFTTWSMSTYSFDISPWNDAPYYFAITNGGGYAANVDFVRGGELHYYGNDLMANRLVVDPYVKTGQETNFEVSFMNIGTQDVLGTQYTVEIRTQDSVYNVIEGVDLKSMEAVTLTVPYIFTTVDTLALHAHIIFDGEARTDNNMTLSSEVFVLDEYTHGGVSTSTTSSFLQIGNMNAISEMIYYPSEVGLYGQLKGFEFSYDMTYDDDETGVPVTFYAATTQSDVLVSDADPYTPSWIETDSLAFTQVFKGTIDFKKGKNQSIYIPFNGPFEYDVQQNLIIIAIKDSMPSVYKYPSFHTMDSETPRFIYGNNNSHVIDPSNIVVNWGGSVNSYQVPNLRFHFTNPGAPVFESVPVTEVIEDAAYNYQVEVAFEGPSAFTLEAPVLPSWLTVEAITDTTFALVGTPDMPGLYPVKLVITDSMYSSVQRFDITVFALPEFVSSPVSLIAETETYSYTAEVSYSGSTPVQIAGVNNPSWITVTDNGNNTATVTGTPVATGEFNISLKATGEGGASATQNYMLAVGAVPSFTSTPVTTGSENSVYTYNVTAAINGSETLAITSDELPTWLTLTDNGNGTAVITGTPTTMGVYHVSLKAAGTYFSATQAYDIDITVGVNDVAANNFVVYPNPASQYIQILNIDKATIEIFDITGQLVKVQESVSSTDKIDVSEMNNGIYVIVLTNNQGKASKQFIIE